MLFRATSLHRAYTTQRHLPTSPMPGYLEARGAAGHAVRRVEVTVPQSGEEDQEEVQEAGANGKRKATGEARGRGGGSKRPKRAQCGADVCGQGTQSAFAHRAIGRVSLVDVTTDSEPL